MVLLLKNAPAIQEAQVEKIPGIENGTPFLSGKSRRQRSLAGYSLWGHKESDRTDSAHTHKHTHTHTQTISIFPR